MQDLVIRRFNKKVGRSKQFVTNWMVPKGTRHNHIKNRRGSMKYVHVWEMNVEDLMA